MEKFRLHPLLKLLLYVILPLILVLAITWVVLDILGSLALEREIAAIKAAGEPVSFSEFAPPLIPDEENAAVCYEQALGLISEGPDFLEGVFSYIERHQPETPEFIQWLRERVEKNRIVLDLLSEGSRRPKCRYKVDYSVSVFTAQIPYFPKIRNCNKLLSAEAIIQIKNNQPDESFKTCQTCLKFINSLKEPPTLITLMIRIGYLDDSLNVLKWLLNQNQPCNPEILRQISEELNPTDLRQSLIKVFQIERCGQLEMLDIIRKEGRLPISKRSSTFLKIRKRLYWSWLGRPLYKRDIAWLLQWTTKIASVSRESYYEAKPDLEKLDREVQNLPFYTCLPRTMATTNLSSCMISNAASETRLWLARLSIMLKLYKSQKGVYPDNLAVLVPDFLPAPIKSGTVLPKDPFSGNDFIYRKQNDGFILYSVGMNGTDDGGKASLSSDTGDIVWELER